MGFGTWLKTFLTRMNQRAKNRPFHPINQNMMPSPRLVQTPSHTGRALGRPVWSWPLFSWASFCFHRWWLSCFGTPLTRTQMTSTVMESRMKWMTALTALMNGLLTQHWTTTAMVAMTVKKTMMTTTIRFPTTSMPVQQVASIGSRLQKLTTTPMAVWISLKTPTTITTMFQTNSMPFLWMQASGRTPMVTVLVITATLFPMTQPSKLTRMVMDGGTTATSFLPTKRNGPMLTEMEPETTLTLMMTTTEFWMFKI